MGRAKYSRSERERRICTFIDAARQMIGENGVDRVSIRAVARQTGYSSASLYLYFSDLDELVSMASVSYLGDFWRELNARPDAGQDVWETYRSAWRLLCRCTFPYADVFERLFFGPRGNRLGETVEAYCRLFPRCRCGVGGRFAPMARAATLEDACFELLRPPASDGALGQAQARLICSLSVGYYHKLLDEKRRLGSAVDDAEQTGRQLEATDFLIERFAGDKSPEHIDNLKENSYNRD